MNKKSFLYFVFYFFVFCFLFFCILFFIFLYFVLFTQNVRVVVCNVVQGVWLNLNCSESDEELLELDNDPVAELE